MAIKLVAVDIDGTLINDQLQITEKTKQAIQTATAKGIKVVLCTGRPMTGVNDYLTQLGLNGKDDQYVISFNGALVQSTAGKVLAKFTLPLEDVIDLAGAAFKQDVKLVVETADYMYSLNQDISPYAVHESKLVSLPLRYRSLDQIVANQDQLVFSKVMLTDKPEKLDRFLSHLEEDEPVRNLFNIVRSEPYYLEFINPAASKGAALEALGHDLAIAPNEMVAIGNAQNDEAMLKAAGTGVAMANATAGVRKIADVQVADNNHDGVAEAFHDFVF